MAASGHLRYVQLASVPSAYDVSVYNAGTTDIPAFTAVVIDSSNIMEDTDMTLNTIAVAKPAATAGLTAFAVTKEIIKAKGTGRAWGPGAVATAIAEGTVTQGTFVGTSGTTAGSLATATVNVPYVGLALATAATTEYFPVLLTPGTAKGS